MELSLRDRLLRYIRKEYPNWIHSGAIERLVAEKTSYKPSNSSRRLRELTEEGLLEARKEKGSVLYRAKAPASIKSYSVPTLGITKTIPIWG